MRDALGSVQSLLVLGGTSEIALATARRMGADRLRTAVLAARDTAAAEAAAGGLREAGVESVDVVPFTADDVASHERLVNDAFDRHGDIDAVLVAVGVLGPGTDEQLDAAVDVLRVNVLGAVSPIVPAVRRLRAQGHGTLIVLSSVAGERARRSNFVYGSSKAGLDAFAQGLGDWLAGSGVGVLVVRPGFVRTKMTSGMADAPLAVGPERVAEAIVDGLRRGAHTVWAPPAMRWVALVLRLLPRPIFRRLPF